jgi:hypothetical protein
MTKQKEAAAATTVPKSSNSSGFKMCEIKLTEKELEPVFQNLNRANELVRFSKEKGWSEAEFLETLHLLHSIFLNNSFE